MSNVFNWEFDASIGVYKNHHISNKLLVQSMAKLKIAPFTTPIEQGFRHKGEIVNIMHIKELPDPTSTQLEESTRIPIDKIRYGNRPIRVVEWGRGVEYTNLAQQLSKFDPASTLQKALIRQMERALDIAASRNGFFSTDAKVVFTPTSATGGTFSTNGLPGAGAGSNQLKFAHMGILADYLAGDLQCPPYEGEDYIMLACRKTLRGLKSDQLWQQVHMYLQKGDLFFKGEVGKAENIRCIQVDHEKAISNSTGTATGIGEAVIFGDEAVARIEVEPPQLYADPNYQNDFGRTKAIAWRGIFAFATIWDTANSGEAKIIKILSQ